MALIFLLLMPIQSVMSAEFDFIQPGQAGGDNTLLIITAAIIIIIIIAVLVYFLMLRKIDPSHATMTGSSLKRNIVG
jgi:hypothetical protein